MYCICNEPMFVLYNFRTLQGLKHKVDPFVLYIVILLYVYTRYLSISKTPKYLLHIYINLNFAYRGYGLNYILTILCKRIKYCN